MDRPTCPKCQRKHGPGILCETFAAWEDDIFRPAVATKSGAAVALTLDALEAMIVADEAKQ